jgi:hypothetical protein
MASYSHGNKGKCKCKEKDVTDADGASIITPVEANNINCRHSAHETAILKPSTHTTTGNFSHNLSPGATVLLFASACTCFHGKVGAPQKSYVSCMHNIENHRWDHIEIYNC